MRKRLLTLISIQILLLGCVSKQPATPQEMNHEFIVEYTDISKPVLFDRTLKWIANNFRSAKQVVEYQNIESGSIIGNGITFVQVEGALLGVNLEFTMNIDVKDEKVRYRFSNFYYTVSNVRTRMPNTQIWHSAAHHKFENMIQSLKLYTVNNDDF
jgi:hypothetical protein